MAAKVFVILISREWLQTTYYFECFALQTLRVFNVLYASLHTVLYEP